MDIDSIIKRRRPAIRRQIADLTQQRIEQLQGKLTDGAVAELVRDFLGDDSLDDETALAAARQLEAAGHKLIFGLDHNGKPTLYIDPATGHD